MAPAKAIKLRVRDVIGGATACNAGAPSRNACARQK
jgi:hypothetical protein